MLLTGARGTGKSSLIKACLNEFAPRGPAPDRGRQDRPGRPARHRRPGGRAARALHRLLRRPELRRRRARLQGAEVDARRLGRRRPRDNVLIYATSNRRHLLPEYMKENLSYQHTEDGEVHPGEVIEEKISLSERFGLWVSFYPFSQDEYLAIVAAVAARLRRRRRGDRRGAPGVAGLGARARLALGPRRLPVRRDYAGAPRVSGGAGERRRPVDVAVGVLIDARRPLPADLAARPARSTPATGSSRAASSRPARRSSRRCARELHEELGITIGAARALAGRADGLPARARAAALLQGASTGSGEFEMREGQAMAWQTLPVQVAPVLPGTLPVLRLVRRRAGLRRRDLRRRGGRRYTAPMNWLDEVKWDARRPGAGDRAGGRQRTTC